MALPISSTTTALFGQQLSHSAQDDTKGSMIPVIQIWDDLCQVNLRTMSAHFTSRRGPCSLREQVYSHTDIDHVPEMTV